MSDILKERQKTHGDFSVNAYIAQEIKDVYRECFPAMWECLNETQKQSLDMIASKIGRIFCTPDNPDHWEDVAGYAKLGGGWKPE